MWPTILIYNTAVQILRTFHFSFLLLRHATPSYSFNWYFLFSLHFIGCAWTLTENYQSTFSHFNNRNAKMRLCSSTDYLEYQQKIKNVFRYENKVFVAHSLAFSSNKRKGNSLKRHLKKKLKKVKWKTSKEVVAI